MIKARHRQWARVVFYPVIRGLLRGSFGHFYAVNRPPGIPADTGLLITPNHFSWWDGFFIHQLLYPMRKRRVNVMMLERQLRRYWYFRHLGAYSIDPGRPKSVMESLRYTSSLLDDPAELAVVYPQGEIETYNKRPLTLQPGIVHSLKKTEREVTVLPIFFRVEYFESRKPDIWFSYGTPRRKSTVVSDFEGFCTDFNAEKEAFDLKVETRGFLTDCFKNRNASEWKIL